MSGKKLLDRIENRDAVVGVLGLGYVGLPLAVEFGKAGFRVLGFEVSDEVVAGINAGRSHVKDVTSESVLKLVEQEMLEATTDTDRLAGCDSIIVCVPTPLGKTKDPDVSFVVAATSSVADNLRPGQLIVLESTTYPGTTRELMLPMLEESGLEVGEDYFLCFSPERVDPGNEVWQIKNTPKVIGGIADACREMGVALYSRVIDTVIPVHSTEAAELTKLLENTFRSVNIALVNEMAQIADRLGVDIWEVIDAAASKPFGYMRFTPGPGIGGHCIPLDPHYLSWKMKTLNYRTRMIEQAGEINSEMPLFVVNKIQDALNRGGRAVNGSRILVLGVAYKKDVNDLRESPALDIIQQLSAKGADVVFHDPHVHEFTEDGRQWEWVDLTEQELASADCVVITTDHSAVDYARVVRIARLVVDTRNATGGHPGANVVGLSGELHVDADTLPLERVAEALG